MFIPLRFFSLLANTATTIFNFKESRSFFPATNKLEVSLQQFVLTKNEDGRSTNST